MKTWIILCSVAFLCYAFGPGITYDIKRKLQERQWDRQEAEWARQKAEKSLTGDTSTDTVAMVSSFE